MCGIFVVFSKSKPLNKNKCLKALADIENRGPDISKYNFYEKDTLFIANSVLSITGKKLVSKKIISSKSNNFDLAFNGEIYNYLDLNFMYNLKSRTEGDAETLCDLHDKINHDDIPIKLNGMFAYVIFDKKNKTLLMANDSQGEKNLYYFDDKNYFIVSSTIKSIYNFCDKSLDLNINTLTGYFQTRHFMNIENTQFKNIKIFKNSLIASYNLKKDKFIKKYYDNPINWISKKSYDYFDGLKEKELIEMFNFELNKQAKLMIPNKKFGTIVSGGIDSSLQAKIINQHSQSYCNIFVDHGLKKDPISSKISNFNNYFKKNILKIKMNKSRYRDLLDKCYKITKSPMYTHELPSRYLISSEFKKRGCKVFFSADGCDELLGGQQIYLDTICKNKIYKKNVSPYSTYFDDYFKKKKISSDEIFVLKLWRKVEQQYSFINSKRDINLHSSFFLDYFIQSISVANRSNDLICCDNSVEPRNLFIQKNILKLILNLPLRYKINFDCKDKRFSQKYILKKIFEKYFTKKLIYTKSGFSGFPSDVKIDAIKVKEQIENYLKIRLKKMAKYYDQKNLARDFYWKLLNLSKFFNSIRIKI